MYYTNSNENSVASGDRKLSKNEKCTRSNTFKNDKEQVLDLFGPATRERFSPMKLKTKEKHQNDYSDSDFEHVTHQHLRNEDETNKSKAKRTSRISKKGNSSKTCQNANISYHLNDSNGYSSESTSSSASSSSKENKVLHESYGKNHEQDNNQKTCLASDSTETKNCSSKRSYPYHGHFVVDMDNQPDYYGKARSDKAASSNRRTVDTNISNNNMAHIQIEKDVQNQTRQNISKEKGHVRPLSPNLVNDKANSVSAKSPMSSRSYTDQPRLLNTTGRNLKRRRWRRWIGGGLVILVFFSLIFVILCLVLGQKSGYDIMMKNLATIKEKLENCALCKQNKTSERE